MAFELPMLSMAAEKQEEASVSETHAFGEANLVNTS